MTDATSVWTLVGRVYRGAIVDLFSPPGGRLGQERPQGHRAAPAALDRRTNEGIDHASFGEASRFHQATKAKRHAVELVVAGTGACPGELVPRTPEQSSPEVARPVRWSATWGPGR